MRCPYAACALPFRTQEFSGAQLWEQFAVPPGTLVPVLEWLRVVVRERLCARMRRHLLTFCTGVSAIPMGGLAQKISVTLEETPRGQLPVAHTCFSGLRISRDYESVEHLTEQLAKSILSTVASAAHGEGFQMA